MTVGAALLIGNSRYRRESVFRPLATPKNDVQNLGDRLSGLGFATTVIVDADRAAMSAAIAQFRDVVATLADRQAAYIHFAGHGIQRAGENYLVPVDAAGFSQTEVLFSCIRMSDVLDTLCWREDQQKLIVLDACRSNHVPTAARSGVAGLAGESPNRYERVHETFMLYATAAGSLALDGAEYGTSPLCLGLLESLRTPSIPIALLAAQITDAVYRMTGRAQKPWGTGNLCHLWPFIANEGGSAHVHSASMGTLAGERNARWVADDREIARSGHLIHKIRAKDTSGRWAYYFVLVEPRYESQFLAAIEGDGTVNIEQFGRVIASNYGEEPTDEVRAYLKQRYGFDV